MRLALVATLCVALGFGAGWAVFDTPWRSGSKSERLTAQNITRLTAKVLAPQARDVSCTSDHGPFYACRVYTTAGGGADYAVTVTRNGQCFHARVQRPTVVATLPGATPDFRQDESLPDAYDGWTSSRRDC